MTSGLYESEPYIRYILYISLKLRQIELVFVKGIALAVSDSLSLCDGLRRKGQGSRVKA